MIGGCQKHTLQIDQAQQPSTSAAIALVEQVTTQLSSLSLGDMKHLFEQIGGFTPQHYNDLEEMCKQWGSTSIGNMLQRLHKAQLLNPKNFEQLESFSNSNSNGDFMIFDFIFETLDNVPLLTQDNFTMLMEFMPAKCDLAMFQLTLDKMVQNNILNQNNLHKILAYKGDLIALCECIMFIHESLNQAVFDQVIPSSACFNAVNWPSGVETYLHKIDDVYKMKNLYGERRVMFSALLSVLGILHERKIFTERAFKALFAAWQVWNGYPYHKDGVYEALNEVLSDFQYLLTESTFTTLINAFSDVLKSVKLGRPVIGGRAIPQEKVTVTCGSSKRSMVLYDPRNDPSSFDMRDSFIELPSIIRKLFTTNKQLLQEEANFRKVINLASGGRLSELEWMKGLIDICTPDMLKVMLHLDQYHKNVVTRVVNLFSDTGLLSEGNLKAFLDLKNATQWSAARSILKILQEAGLLAQVNVDMLFSCQFKSKFLVYRRSMRFIHDELNKIKADKITQDQFESIIKQFKSS
ncbi:hypothetical protein EDM02_03840 [Candidatus Cardinium hertigii]|uniref:Uncharacterized protein n=2 Tax=Candidatus Cardinium hertigii TaxID=247481 RepID=A0A3N2QBU8_9BACT|nr:hypothetical protein EDM02_03840 [Candidatus Cardinium hertigii]